MLTVARLTLDASHALTPATVWRSWSAEPGVIAPLVFAAMAYGMAVRNARGHGGARVITTRRIAAFAAGWIALAVALVSPLDRLAEELFAAHMTQHLMVMVVAAPLCVLGAPPVVWLWALPPNARSKATGWWLRSPRAQRVLSWIWNPPLVLVAQTAALWFWHFPRPYQAALASPAIHAVEHASFFGTAVLFWWVTLHPVGRRTLGFGQAILYLGITLGQSGALGALLMLSAHAWYPMHAAGEALWGITPLDDQQLAGLIMWIPASTVYLGAACVLFVRWMHADERTVRASERTSMVAS